MRIELGEIASVLKQHHLIHDAVTMVREERPDDKRIVAYVITKENSTDTELFHAYLKSKLPSYMVPSSWVLLEHFPLTPNGKLDKKALPKPMYQREKEYVEPRTELEITLAQIVKYILNIETIGIHDRFFDLGLTSLNSFRLIALARSKHITISIQQLNTFDTISLLAHSIIHNRPSHRWVKIRKNSDSVKECIVLIPPAGGSIDSFKHLIQRMDYPLIYAIQSIEEDLKETSIQALAKKIAGTLIHEIPNTRYILVGHSFGAIVAYEMAQILEKSKLHSVFMLDTSPLINNYYKITGDIKLHGIAMFATINKASTDELHQLVTSLAKISDEERIDLYRKMINNEITVEQIEYFVDFYMSNMKQIGEYNCTINKQKTEFIFCKAQDQGLFNDSYGLLSAKNDMEQYHDEELSGLISNLKVCPVPGNHISMLHEPHVASLARVILNDLST